jgi:hypothetical protein
MLYDLRFCCSGYDVYCFLICDPISSEYGYIFRRNLLPPSSRWNLFTKCKTCTTSKIKAASLSTELILKFQSTRRHIPECWNTQDVRICLLEEVLFPYFLLQKLTAHERYFIYVFSTKIDANRTKRILYCCPIRGYVGTQFIHEDLMYC